MPTTTQQVVFLEGGAVAIEDVEIPDPASNQILIRSTRSLISAGTELNILELSATGRGEPGYSMVGEVAQVGRNVEGYAEGDRVLTYLKHQGAGLITIDPDLPDEPTYAGHIPDDVSDEDASFVVLGDVALHGVRRAGPGLGDSVAVFGQGGLGQMVTQFARMAGAYPVIAIDLLDERLALARWSGATHTVNAQREDAVAAVQDITGGGARVVFMVTRTPKILPDCMRAAAAGGTISMTGSPPGTVEIGLQVELLRKELSIIGTYQSMYPREPYHMFQWTRAANRQYILDALARGEFRVDRLISHREPYTKAADLYAMIERGPAGWLSIILQWDQA
ncbi:MAG: zinc-binding dehydrogenase [Chloroflexota bacterium]|nr:zinc-binding dehydrogenase [Chloroflexota bacterium]MDE2898370.1 zinc-binding dehydrogenase [Chloroflexota bacterium]